MPKFEHTKAYQQIKCIRGYSMAIVKFLTDEVRIPPRHFKFVTQTLSPKLYSKSRLQQFQTTINDLISVLDYISEDYNLVTEITDDGNVHYHFWVIFKERFSYCHYKEIISNNYKFGFNMLTKIKHDKTTLQQQQNTYSYMIKSIEKTYDIIRCKSIVTNKSDHNIDVNTSPDDYDTDKLDYRNEPFSE